ncbi:hypothetical protein FK268_07795 [Tsukamurella sputi]|uniref:DUF5642 domain-containing protein n=1 Tax=Tsukamurella sputi TaxID=2591848 RepID=A0A5C5RR95_9ACTN|nr:hypothetical protein [Tsukamurella sputi]TWS25112.1 hypothetical protein FK268_07795 [Tsukamurella sputi]
MRVRHLLAGSTVAVLAAVGLPGLAQAAPIVPAQAVLAAHEFPAGSTEYKARAEVGEPAGQLVSDSVCGRAEHAVDQRLEGARSTDASARRGALTLESSVIDRPMSATMRNAFTTCAASTPASSRLLPSALPADLSRYQGFVVRIGAGQALLGVVDVRGASVGVSVEGGSSSPADEGAFFQVLRAQVAKVERQP